MHYVILGNGVAGTEAALALRRREAEARISVVSSEHDHFFSRPALMYVFCGQLDLEATEPYNRGLYERLRFERCRQRVITPETEYRCLCFENEGELSYDRLLVAVGSKPRPAAWPGSAGPGLHYFVSLDDLRGLDEAARSGMRAVVIGGGLIGVEVAEVLLQRGLHVTFVIRENWHFPMALDESESSMVAAHLRRHGCDVRVGADVEEIRRDAADAIRAVATTAGEIECDLVVASIGVVPNTAFLAESGLSLSSGGAIEVGESLRTSDPHVWAAGDCANVGWIDGSRRPEQLWYTARDQGRLAAQAMLGDECVYRRGSWYNSAKFFDVEYTTAGWVPARLNWDNTPIDPGPDVRDWSQMRPEICESERIVVKGDRVVGFNMLGRRWNHAPFLRWIEERRDLDYVLAHLGEAQFDEEFTRPFAVRQEAID